VKCPACSHDNPPAVRYCAGCGAPLASGAEERSGAETLTLAGPEGRFPTGTVIAGRYQVIEEIGRGGMGAVFKVFDRAVQEKIALKVINPGAALKHDGLARFRNELTSARRISHRNVCRVFDLGEHEGLTFLTMEYVSGENLRKIIRMTGPLAVPAALGIARQVCRGLAEAHKLGVVHRDLKPHNIMIDAEGTAKIMDFGIARAEGAEDLTAPGARLGTPGYMAPEQIEGGRADERSDIFALGLILREMVTGSPSRREAGAQSVPPPGVPAGVEGVIRKCLEGDPERRYQSAAELLGDLESLESTGRPVSEDGSGRMTSRRRRGKPSRKAAAAGAAVLLLAGAALLILRPFSRRLSLAVLPFENSEDKSDPGSPAESLSDNIRSKLSELNQLRVISKLSSEQFQASSPDLELIHRRLGVRRVVTGELRPEGGSHRLDVLVSSTDGSSPPWSRRYDVEPAGQFQTENDVVLDIAEALGLSVGGEVMERFSLREPVSQEAYRHFQWGESFQEKFRESGSGADFDASLESYQRAAALDPGYALAFWGMGNLYESRYVRSSEARDLIRMLNSYEQAYRANPRLAEPFLGRGWALFYEQKFDQAWENFRQALRIDPDNPEVQLHVGSFLRSTGLFREAMKFYEEAIRLDLDPLNTMPHRLMAVCAGYLGEVDRAVGILRRAIGLDRSSAGIRLDLARMLLLKGDIAGARAQLEEAERQGAGAGALDRVWVWLLAAEGKREKALAIIPSVDYACRYEITNAYCLLGMNDEAIRNIRLGLEAGFRELKELLYTSEYLSGNPLYHGLRLRPEFAALLEEQKALHRERREKFGGL
jgi:serine/threonine-protein kinase